jgi:exonuclease VII large subunit
MLRVADQNLDKFELYTLKNVFAVPEDLQLASPQPMVTEEESQLDAETEALWAQLQRSLATKRELQRKLTAAQRTTELWAAHRESVHKLAASQQASNVQGTLQGLQRLSDTLQDGWHLLRSSDGVGGDSGSLVPGPRGAAPGKAQAASHGGTQPGSDCRAWHCQ